MVLKHDACLKSPNIFTKGIIHDETLESNTLILIALVGLAATVPVMNLLLIHMGIYPSLDNPISTASHTNYSLFQQYVMDFQDILVAREKNFLKYTYSYSHSGVDKRSNLSLQEFWDVYDGKWPVIVTDVVHKWPAFNWNQDFFYKTYGQNRVTMKVIDSDLDSVISEILEAFPNGLKEQKDEFMHERKSCLESAVSLALPLELFNSSSIHPLPHRWAYVEDELFIQMRPELRRDIGECQYMDEDYFKLFPEEIRPWNAMLLWGTKYSRSSLHIDPYNWTGTNAVIKGHKRWKLYPPGQDHLLSIMKDRMAGFPLNCRKYNSPIDAFEPDYGKYPEFLKAEVIEVDQLPGEMLFIPSGWFHQAFNMEETIAISSELMNHNNYRIVLEEILKVGTISREVLPADIDNKSPHQQVETIMKLLPPKVLQLGYKVTKNVLEQIHHVHEDLYDYQIPLV